MCGIAGFARLDGDTRADDTHVVDRMLDAIAHRGPDGRGRLDFPGASIGACRLAVLDPSERAAQPMSTVDGRYHLVHNGEIYDHVEHRPQLERDGVVLRSSGDTEVLLHLLARHAPAVLNDCNGMFASALWDDHERRLLLVRDRFGVKPLVYAEHAGALWFASEEKALFAAGVPARFDTSTWPELLLLRHVAGDRTPFAGVHRLLPGHALVVERGRVESMRWWDRPESDADVDPARLLHTLDEAVALQLRSDVPVGVLLSGGVDSATVATLSARRRAPLHAYTLCYPGERMDEAARARDVAGAAGLVHHEVTVDDAEVPELLEQATWYRGAPIAQVACPHLLALARVAKRDVTVVLSGEGADELLGGYDRYRAFRHPRLVDLAGRALRVRRRHESFRARIATAAPADRFLVADAYHFAGVPVGEVGGFRRRAVAEAMEAASEPVRQALRYEQQTHLQAVLENGDRSTMGAGVELRVPFLDPRVVALADAAPTAALFDGRLAKPLLRRAARDLVPASVLAHQKRGWSAPWPRYLRRIPPLRRYVEALAGHDVLEGAPVARPTVDAAVSRFLAGETEPFTLVWMLARIAVWHDVCVAGKRGVFA